MVTSEFDASTQIEEAGDGAYAVTLSPGWGLGEIANGGYLLSVACRALGRALGRPDPVTVTGHFFRPAQVAPAVVHVEPLRNGRLLATGQARLVQHGRERLRVLAGFGDLGGEPGRMALHDAAPPEMPPPDACVPGPTTDVTNLAPPIADRFDLRYHPGTAGWLRREPSGRPEIGAWIRLRDGRPPDTAVLPVVVDALAPTVFGLGYLGWVPTLELTVHVRARPAPGWLRSWARSRVLGGDLVEEDVDVWDSNGTLVAMARQLARMPEAPPP